MSGPSSRSASEHNVSGKPNLEAPSTSVATDRESNTTPGVAIGTLELCDFCKAPGFAIAPISPPDPTAI
ncbi:hypothetical protein SBOR_5935 [Sclerotinia borealis F-4128]|uniref:Uncharacterized protein n=1 Tax=Sclerotinia borealis (strain F-4128) TaxID=1432307 RepID=W9CGM0_SCLBF|nr:hypothetical protein SBOR_5935 [Sclerotinia borealis F-4128]